MRRRVDIVLCLFYHFTPTAIKLRIRCLAVPKIRFYQPAEDPRPAEKPQKCNRLDANSKTQLSVRRKLSIRPWTALVIWSSKEEDSSSLAPSSCGSPCSSTSPFIMPICQLSLTLEQCTFNSSIIQILSLKKFCLLTFDTFSRACEPNHGVCSFPSAHVQLTKRHQLLKFGQKYRVYLNLEMPESPKNKNLGLYKNETHHSICKANI